MSLQGFRAGSTVWHSQEVFAIWVLTDARVGG